MASPCAAALDLPPPVDVPRRVIVVAAAALINQDQQVLICDRPAGKDLSGYWEFPGGKLDAGETPEIALMRELREELGIETRPTCYWPIGFVTHPYTKKDTGENVCFLMMLYVCRVWRGDPQPLEGQQMKWVAPKQLYNHNIIPSDLPLVAQLIDRV